VAIVVFMTECPAELTDLFSERDGVLDVASVLRYLPRGALRWQLESGRWQQPCRGVVIAHSGPVTEIGRLWLAILGSGRGAVLAGLTAARLDGLTWLTRR
jgi:hypothetical protein